jgi:hypothetical protein
MRYTVVWDSAAQDELARIWLKASDPQAVADASDYIDKRLRSFAERIGDAYGDDRRLVIEPLALFLPCIRMTAW